MLQIKKICSTIGYATYKVFHKRKLLAHYIIYEGLNQ
jgi:hypothetical protein